MADDTQQQSPGILSSIGSAIGKALPYALPAALGAALGGPMGAIAGMGMGAQGMQEAQAKQQEMQLRQQEIGMRWQEFGLQKQKATQALQSEQSYQDWVDTQPEEDRKMLKGLPAEARGEVLTKKMDDKEWEHTAATFKGDPSFLKEFNLTPADVTTILKLPGGLGKPMLTQIMAAAKANNLEQVRFIQQQALTAQREASANARQDKSIAAADARTNKLIAARTTGGTTPPSPLAIEKQARAQADRDWAALPMTATRGGMFGGVKHDDFIKERTAKYQKELSGDTGATAPSSNVSDFLKKHGISG
jgi:hypothetical protein